MQRIDTGYDPSDIEEKWYKFWETQNLFWADNESKSEHYSIVIPPPNVTGSLHMGHALNNTLQDILIRTRRMQGRNTLWMPGTDHAGIATQNVVEKGLAEEGKTRHDLGREKFVERVWEWRKKYGGVIINQLKKLGASCDWSRERFTMDEGLSRAVRYVFVTLFNDGLIYRDDYITNWCPRCRTALADLEVEHENRKGSLYYIRYPVLGEDGKYVVVATTRPETMFGDTAVAVNPEDKRYSVFKGKKIILPVIGRELPIIFDSYVDMEFGTGALKITPAHDLNDFEIGNDHELERIVVINQDGTMNEGAGPYVGMDRYEARDAVVSDLKEQNLLEKVEDYDVPVGLCYRCRTDIEPLLSKQWFVRAEVLAKEAISAVEDKRTRIVPQQWEKTYFEWMRNIKPWCVSRQIWWGHRIPAWYCDDCNEVLVSMDDLKECTKCKGSNLRRETDVLDTWFSSALWPFSTLGWPDKTKDLEVYYPTSCLVTGFDILFFWVARMMMMGLYFMGDVPFRDVYIHALVRDPEGRKMSKSLGNIIDPLVVIEQYGADAFRFTLSAFAAQGRDIKLSESRIEGYRFFINKLWNAARFVLMNLDDEYVPDFGFKGRDLTLADRWILSRLQKVVSEVTSAFDNYEFNNAASSLYQFIWHEFCDWYLELSKIYLYSEEDAAKKRVRDILVYSLDTILKLLHPITPFVTEEIYSKLPSRNGSIVRGPFPVKDDSLVFDEDEVSFGEIKEIITGIRNVRSEWEIHPKEKLSVVITSDSDSRLKSIEENITYIQTLSGTGKIDIGVDIERPTFASTVVSGNYVIDVPLEGVVDPVLEKGRLDAEVEKVIKELSSVEGKLSNKKFIQKAPEDVIAKERDKKEKLVFKKAELENRIEIVKRYMKK